MKRCEDCDRYIDGPSYATRCKPCFARFKRDELDYWKNRAQVAEAVRVTAGAPLLDLSTLRAVIQLTHPDKHAGSELAGKITAILLAIKRRQEGGL